MKLDSKKDFLLKRGNTELKIILKGLAPHCSPIKQTVNAAQMRL